MASSFTALLNFADTLHLHDIVTENDWPDKANPFIDTSFFLKNNFSIDLFSLTNKKVLFKFENLIFFLLLHAVS